MAMWKKLWSWIDQWCWWLSCVLPNTAFVTAIPRSLSRLLWWILPREKSSKWYGRYRMWKQQPDKFCYISCNSVWYIVSNLLCRWCCGEKYGWITNLACHTEGLVLENSLSVSEWLCTLICCPPPIPAITICIRSEDIVNNFYTPVMHKNEHLILVSFHRRNSFQKEEVVH